MSSYPPTLLALCRARAIATALPPQDVRFLAVSEGQAPGKPTLWKVDQETTMIEQLAGASSIKMTGVLSSPTLQEVVERANMIHLACRGEQALDDPLGSGFCLRDDMLTVPLLMKLHLKDVFFAFLSACETAVGDKTNPDATIHLAAAMLFAGFQSVIVTMWKMQDEDGSQVANMVYEKVFGEEIIDAVSIPYALDAAAQEMRAQNVPPER